MILERTNNTKRNIVWGWINKFLKIICPFIIRTIIIKKFGVQYLGLNSLFTSVLSMLSLAEMGFDSAVVFIMYKGVAENNEQQLSALLLFLKKVYYVVGTVVLIVGCICIPFLKYLIKDINSVPADMNIYIIYMVFLANTISSYYFGGYCNSIINAYQRCDIISNISSVVSIVSFLIQLIILQMDNYYYYIISLPIFTIITNLLTVYQSRKLFPNIKPKGEISYEEKKELIKLVRGTFMAKLGGVLSVSLDNVVASAFLGLTVLAYYSNYSYIITAIQGFLVVIYTSMQAGVGNSIILDSKEKNYQNMCMFTFMFNWIIGICTICFMYLFQPFIQLWIGAEGILPNIVLVFICLNFYFSINDAILGTYKAALGIWWEDRYRCILAGIVNLILNIGAVFLLRSYGEYYALIGIVGSTIVTQLFILTPWAAIVTFKGYFEHGLIKYYLQLFTYFVVTAALIILCYPIFAKVSIALGIKGILNFLIRLVICIVVTNVVYVIIYRNTTNYKNAKKFVLTKLRR